MARRDKTHDFAIPESTKAARGRPELYGAHASVINMNTRPELCELDVVGNIPWTSD